MQFMGDAPLKKKATQSDCLNHVLLVSALTVRDTSCVCFCEFDGGSTVFFMLLSVREGKGAAEG